MATPQATCDFRLESGAWIEPTTGARQRRTADGSPVETKQVGVNGVFHNAAMTLHVALVCNSYVIQLGDRLLTQRHGSRLLEWEPLANKSIFVQVENGQLVIGYAGLAHIDGTPTDEWLVENITGEPPITGPMGGKAVRNGPPLDLDVGHLIGSISTAIETELPRQPDSRTGLEILITGWTWRRDVGLGSARPRTYARKISHGGVSGKKSLVRKAEARLYKPQSTDWDLLSIPTASTVRTKLEADITESMRGRRTTADDVETIIAARVRNLARQPNSGIGTDLMSIYLPMAWEEDPRVRFLRDDTHSIDAYGPAVILTGGMIMYPTVIRGGMERSIVYAGTEDQPREIKVETVPPMQQSSITEIWGQPRRPFST